MIDWKPIETIPNGSVRSRMKASDVNKLIKAEAALKATFALDNYMPRVRFEEWIKAKNTLQEIAGINHNELQKELGVEDDT